MPTGGIGKAVQQWIWREVKVLGLYSLWRGLGVTLTLLAFGLYVLGAARYLSDLREGSCDRTSFEPTERKKDRGWRIAGPFAPCFLPSRPLGSARVTPFVTSR